MPVRSLYLNGYQSSIKKAPLGWGGSGGAHQRSAADKSVATVWRNHVNVDQNLWECFQHTLVNKEFSSFWKQKVVQLSSKKVYLIKWLVNFFVCLCVIFLPSFLFWLPEQPQFNLKFTKTRLSLSLSGFTYPNINRQRQAFTDEAINSINQPRVSTHKRTETYNIRKIQRG